MIGLTEILFWLAAAASLYAYVGFPLFLFAAALLRPRPVRRKPEWRSVSVVIAAYNEERTIHDRIDNALGQDYPSERIEVIVVSDGSDDATDRIVVSHPDSRVRLVRIERSGKVHALNRAVEVATGDILVFSDANTMFERRAVRRLVRNFADPEVGGVAGRKIYSADPGSDSCSRGETSYWSYDMWIKRLESASGSTVSADGAIYAIRRSLYRPVTDAAVTDDFAISTQVVEQGQRLVFDAEAVAYESTVPAAEQEFRRKVRLMTRGMRSVVLRRGLLDPRKHGLYSVHLLSHKVVRRLVPVFLLTLLATSLALTSKPLFLAAFLGQAVFYLAAVAGWALRRHRFGRIKPLAIPFYYCLANLAALVALGRLVSGQRVERWQPQRHAAQS